MELYYMLNIIDRNRARELQKIIQSLKLSVIFGSFGNGTATTEHLLLYDLQKTEKAVISMIATGPTMRQFMRLAKKKMFIDIPGNGIVAAIPIKSVSGGRNLAYFTDGQELGGAMPIMNFDNELIIVILNEGYSDAVMDAARGAGANGGTVLRAKGTWGKKTEKFFGMSLADAKEIIYILAPANKKSDIMKCISEKCGTETRAGAISFSVPVSETVGMRKQDEDE